MPASGRWWSPGRCTLQTQSSTSSIGPTQTQVKQTPDKRYTYWQNRGSGQQLCRHVIWSQLNKDWVKGAFCWPGLNMERYKQSSISYNNVIWSSTKISYFLFFFLLRQADDASEDWRQKSKLSATQQPIFAALIPTKKKVISIKFHDEKSSTETWMPRLVVYLFRAIEKGEANF